MNIYTLGTGFIASHLPYTQITDRFPTNDQAVATILEHYKPDVIVNTLGRCGSPNVDWCETNQTATYAANVVLPLMLAEWCEKHSVRMVHLGSGCIYYGKSPNYYLERQGDPHYMEDTMVRRDAGWKETDPANAQSYYSKTKYACDLALGDLSHIAILRLRMPISSKNSPRNLISKLCAYSKVLDVPNSMTFTDDLVRCIDWVIKENKSGIWHIANDPPLTAVQVMQEYQKYRPEHSFKPLDEQELDQLTIAKRSNCILNTDKLWRAGFRMTNSEEALKRTMKEYCNG